MSMRKAWPRERLLQLRVRTGVRRVSTLLCVIVLQVVLLACTQEASKLDLVQGLPIPVGGHDVKKMQLGASPSNQQLFFRIERKYPEKDVFELYNVHFAREKWRECRGGLGWKDGWDTYVDESTTPPQRIHRIVSLWIRPDQRAYALVTGMYSSHGSAPSSNPDSAEQRWILLLQKDVDALSEARRLSFQCDR